MDASLANNIAKFVVLGKLRHKVAVHHGIFVAPEPPFSKQISGRR
jgi:hypothetical protein